MIDKRETAAWRDQQADAMPSPSSTVECNDEQCDATIEMGEISDSEWLAENDPEIPLLCPDCKKQVSNIKRTPTEELREENHDIGNWA